MKIIRYSIYGFKPQEQTHHMGYFNYQMNEFSLDNIPDHLKMVCKDSHNTCIQFFREHGEDFKRGIWCFVDGHKSNLALNHLTKLVPCWEADIDDDAECYGCNLDKFTKVSDTSIIYGGFYLPEREMHKIRNIKRR